MFNRLATQATALGLAVVFTVLTLGGIDALAEQSAAAQATEVAAAQQVIITGHRLPRG
jgi:hypothetical protein